MLFISIFAEIVGTSSIKYAGDNAGVAEYLFLFSMVSSSYYFLAKAIQRIPMSVAYAIWEGFGMVAMFLLGYWLFDEKIHQEKLLACGVVLTGIMLLHFGRERNLPGRE